MLVHVLAAGPSLKSYVTLGWPDGVLIGTNGVGLICPELSAWCACDVMPACVVEWARKFDGQKFVSEKNKHQFPGACVVKHWDSQGPLHFEEAEIRGFYWHGSVAMMACEIARLLMNARTIFVHGLDYHDAAHCYDDVDPALVRKEKYWDMPLLERNWCSMVMNYKNMGVKLWNANPNSALHALPKLEDWRYGIPAPEMRAI